MKKTLRNILGTGLLVGSLISMGGCVMKTTPAEVGDTIKYFMTGSPTENMRKKDGLKVQTPHGYAINLYKGANVYYQRQLYTVSKVNPPYIYIYTEDAPGLKSIVRIEDLDVFKE